MEINKEEPHNEDNWAWGDNEQKLEVIPDEEDHLNDEEPEKV